MKKSLSSQCVPCRSTWTPAAPLWPGRMKVKVPTMTRTAAIMQRSGGSCNTRVLKMAPSRSHLYTVAPKIGIIHILGALGIGRICIYIYYLHLLTQGRASRTEIARATLHAWTLTSTSPNPSPSAVLSLEPRPPKNPKQQPIPAAPNYPLRYLKLHSIETRKPSIEVQWEV